MGPVKIAVSGKGGVGKTTLAALLAHLFAGQGRRVLAVDADPDANLGEALGFDAADLARLVPIGRLKELVEDRTGATPGEPGQLFALDPRVDDLPEQLWVERGGVRLLVMGGVRGGGAGCACPENSLLRSLLRHLVVERSDTVIVDLEAGLETLGRGTARHVDVFIVVVEPGRRSFATAREVARLAAELGLLRVLAVANKVRPGEREAVAAGVRDIAGLPLLGCLPFDPAAAAADLLGRPVAVSCPALVEAAGIVAARVAAAAAAGRP